MAGTVEAQRELLGELPDCGDEPLSRLFLELQIDDPELVAALSAYAEGPERDEFATSALRIGVLALRQARGQLDAGLVQRECQQMLAALEKQLAEHSLQLNSRLAGSLQEYFDPKTGRFQERVNRLIERDGELEQMLRRQLGAEDSELCRTLTTHVGASSPLMKLLSPTESQGLLTALRETFGRQLADQRETVLREFSFDNEQGAISRMVRQLSETNGQLARNLQGKIDEVVKEFDLGHEGSALYKLVRNVTTAQQTITAEFSLNNDQSALSRLKKMLEATDQAIRGNLTLDDENSSLSRLKREMLGILDTHQKSNQQFQQEVKVALASMVAKRAEAARGTQHGIEFEAVAFEFLDRLAQQAGDIAEATGNSTGLLKNCKKGDCVLALGPDSAAPGARIVIEAKEKQKFDLRAALDELDEARKNRNAQVGMFIFSRKAAPAGIEPVARWGNDVVVMWDAEDSATDLYLRVGLTLARALCVRAANQRAAQSADFTAIEAAMAEISKQSDDLDKVAGWAETVRKNGENIIEHLRKKRAAIERQLTLLQEHVVDLKQTMQSSGSP
ncbi:MAG TPA: hypothetical protein VHZ24_04840 [Pirellulales bacterium]|jgi:hypothetical protein|nr:hypothetical protein [Pirellulales bacterium]